jgi:hypothetical protein
MNIMTLTDIPPWEWPANADEIILEILVDETASNSERLLAAGMAGDATVVNDVLADALLSIICNGSQPDDLRARSTISLGPALEYAFIEDFDAPDDIPITEAMFSRIQQTFYEQFMDSRTPKLLQRRILEASVRAPQEWHQNAVRDAYIRNDNDWKLTAVFCMQYIRGFDKQILEALSSENPDIVYEAVCGAGNWEIDAAWPQISAFVTSAEIDRDLLLAAIEAAALIRPHEASDILNPLLDSDDEDIVDAVYEALAMSDVFWDDDEDAPTIH